jgi:hypothetical protein
MKSNTQSFSNCASFASVIVAVSVKRSRPSIEIFQPVLCCAKSGTSLSEKHGINRNMIEAIWLYLIAAAVPTQTQETS